MAIEIINVGSAPNDGQGDPVRTAYIKTNNNFIELYARAQTSPPATLQGSAGDVAGMYAYDSDDFYFCFQDYDGSSIIWGVLNTSGNVVVTGISSGTSNVSIPTFSGPVRIGVGGIGNVAVFANTGASITGNLTTTGDLAVTGNIATSDISGTTGTFTTVVGTLSTAAQPSITSVGTLAGLTVSGNILPSANVTYDLGSSSQRFNDLYLAGNSIDLAGATITANSTAVVITNPAGGSFTVSGTSAATASSLVNGTSNIIVGASGNVTVSSAGTANVLVASGTGVNVSGTLNTSGNITGGNLTTAGKIDATGNISTSGLFIGTFVGNITGNLVVPGLNTYVLYNNSGNAGADSGFTYSGGTVSVSANVSAGNVLSSGVSTTTGNVTGGNLITSGIVSATGNVTGGNLITSAVVSSATINASGNATVGNLSTAGLIVATGNITGGNLVTAGNVSGSYILGNGSQLTGVVASVLQNGTSNVAIATAGDYVRVKVGGVANVAVFTETATYLLGILDVTGNVVAGNLNSNGVVSGTTGVFSGNVSANYYTGNGSLLTGLSTTSISNGTSNVVVGASGNVTVSSAGTANVLIVTATGANITGTLNATGNANVGNIGATTGVFTDISGTLTTAAQTNITSVGTLSALSVTGNIGGGNLSATNISGTLTTAAQTNITSVGTLSALSVTGNASAGNLSVSTGTLSVGNIENTNANGVGNIGTSTTYFNTVFAQATSAQYADLAEHYTADRKYVPGTVVKFGGSAEVTLCDQDHDPEIAGVVSTNPAYIMNAGLQAEHVTAVALTGRVPCHVQGPVRRGQMMVAAGNGRARAESHPNMGTVIGKALEDFNGDTGTIEVVVGRL